MGRPPFSSFSSGSISTETLCLPGWRGAARTDLFFLVRTGAAARLRFSLPLPWESTGAPCFENSQLGVAKNGGKRV